MAHARLLADGDQDIIMLARSSHHLSTKPIAMCIFVHFIIISFSVPFGFLLRRGGRGPVTQFEIEHGNFNCAF